MWRFRITELHSEVTANNHKIVKNISCPSALAGHKILTAFNTLIANSYILYTYELYKFSHVSKITATSINSKKLGHSEVHSHNCLCL